MRILSIETSFDDTAAAVLEFTEERKNPRTKELHVTIVSNILHSQIATHQKTGGIVPEVAAREHVAKIVPVVEAALESVVRRKVSDVSRDKLTSYDLPLTTSPVDAIAVTYGPGLITSLMVGVETARTLAWAWKVPLVAVNHMEGHISVALLKPHNDQFLISNSQQKTKLPITNNQNRLEPRTYTLEPAVYPALALVVSGAHTELVLMKKPLSYHIIGATRDDAVGEAFDKVAKILGLPYPGGPVVSKLAELGNPEVFPFSPPMLNTNNYDFSFSGIKTAVLYKTKELKNERTKEQFVNNICASFQKAVVDVLVKKTLRAAKEYNIKTLILAGGVAANKQLREHLAFAINSQIPRTKYFIPEPQFCTDNAVMIGVAGYFCAQKKFTPWEKLDVNPNLVLGE